MNRKPHVALLLFFALSVFALSIIKIEDTDTWMHLSLGRTIWEHGWIPEKEVFVYTAKDLPFLYTSWLFGVLYYIVFKLLGIHGVILLMAITVTAFYTVLFLDSLRPYKNYLVSLLIITFSIIAMRERFVERPDTFSFLFAGLTIFSLNAYLYEGKKYLYLLPLVSLLWANIHSSIILIFPIYGSYIIGGLIQFYLSKKGYRFLFTPDRGQIRTILLVFLASFLLGLLNPNFIKQYTFGSEIMGRFTWYRHEISELQKPVWPLWKEPFIIAGITFLSFILHIPSLKKKEVKISLIHFLLLLPFAYMNFSAIRFFFTFTVVSLPVIARNLSGLVPSPPLTKRFVLSGVAFLAIFSSLVLLGPLDRTRPPKKFGFGIDYLLIPENALKYMDRNNINGRVFNLFQLGGYIVWRDYPRRSVSIDPRGYVPQELLEKMSLAHGRPELMEELYKTYGFKSYLWSYRLLNPESGYDVGSIHSESGIDAAMRSDNWALLYWDDQFLLYVRRSPEFSEIIKRDEYRYVKPANGAGHIKKLLLYRGLRDEVIGELKRNIEQTSSDNGKLLLAYAYNLLERYDEALDVLRTVNKDNPLIDLSFYYDCLAISLANKGRTEEAIEFYKKSDREFPRPSIPYRIGLLYLNLGDTGNAIRYLKKALKDDPSFISTYPILIDLYKKAGLIKDAESLQMRYYSLLRRNEAEEHFKEGLGLYLKKDLHRALQAFNKSLSVNPYNPSPLINIGYIYLDMGDPLRAIEYFERSIELSASRSEPYYGLGLAYKYLGQKQRALEAFKRYIELEPKGYFTRQAKKQMEALGE